MRKTIYGLLLALGLLLTLDRLETGRAEEGRRRLEEAVRRTAVSCYASEGFYPPTVDYMESHWGLRYDKSRFQVQYECFASNLMPQITVVERGS